MIPIQSNFYDYHLDERRSIDLPKMLEAYFTINDCVGASSQKIGYIVKEIAREAGLEDQQGRGLVEFKYGKNDFYPDVQPHDLRGSWACQAIRSGCNRFRIRDWGGWADVAMLNHYARFVGGGGSEDRAMY